MISSILIYLVFRVNLVHLPCRVLVAAFFVILIIFAGTDVFHVGFLRLLLLA